MARTCHWLLVLAFVVAGCGGGGGGDEQDLEPGVEALDQAMEPDPPRDSGSGPDRAQTFTVGITGRLTRLDLQLYEESTPVAPLYIQIRPTTGGAPVEESTSALAGFAIIPGEIGTLPGEWATFDLTTFDIQVQKGDVLAIVLQSDDERWNWQGEGADGYDDGNTFVRVAPTFPTFTEFDLDQGFRTYVTP